MKKPICIIISSFMMFTSLNSVSAFEGNVSDFDVTKVSFIEQLIRLDPSKDTADETERQTEETTWETITFESETTTEETTQGIITPAAETTTEETTQDIITPAAEITTEETTQDIITPMVEIPTEETTWPAANTAKISDIAFNKDVNLFSVPEGYYITENMQTHLDRLNKNLKTKIVVMVDSIKNSVTAEDIASFTDINTGAIDYNKVWSYCGRLMDTYNTAPYSRKFKTHDGVIVNVPVGDYGWKVDMTGLTQNLYQSLINFKDNVISYKSSSSAFAGDKTVYGNDIGGTYVEVDLTNQNVHWFKDGVCVLSDYCVTGKKSTPTPAGTWSLKCNLGSKTRLKGSTWDVTVNYWAHFTQGCGFHDATWQPSFGLARWNAGHGSHGCVNLSLGTAKKAFNIMQVGEPVVVYYR